MCKLARRNWLRLGLAAWIGLLAAVGQPAVPAPATDNPARWEKDIAAFEAADKTNPPPRNAVLFIGSSSIRLWRSLTRDFPEYPVINRGFGGSVISDSVHFADRVAIPYAPRLIVMYAGGNDINARKPERQVLADFKQFTATIWRRLPQTQIAYISVAPNPARWAQVDKVKTVNQWIEHYTWQDARLDFINVFPHMLGSDGLPKPDIFVADRLHMNTNGYALWRELVRPHLRGKQPLTVSVSRDSAPSSPGRAPVSFVLDKSYALTAVRVYRSADREPQDDPAPVWSLLAEIPSAPTKSFAYGAPIREMRPSSPQGPPPPLQAQETYRVVIEAGEAKGHADFKVD